MSSIQREKVAITTNVLQTLVMMIAVAAVMMEMGRKDQMLDTTAKAVSELRDITTDLARTQVTLSTSNQTVLRQIEDIDQRLRHLERGL
tara:strand:- start:145 stop:411 length:267 start_codon:yes stop_codon:yes gene_type:complete